MKFLVDAHLPQGPCTALQIAGHDAVHTSQLSARNRTTDEVINELSLLEQRVVVTKDSDYRADSLADGTAAAAPCVAPTGLCAFPGGWNPGRRFALPWAVEFPALQAAHSAKDSQFSGSSRSVSPLLRC